MGNEIYDNSNKGPKNETNKQTTLIQTRKNVLAVFSVALKKIFIFLQPKTNAA